jgi:hypothetical protein
MESSGNEPVHLSKIPEMLFSSETSKPFENCMMCNQFLLKAGTGYMIEKAVRQIADMNVREVIFEYAMCHQCAAKMNETLSVESRERIGRYLIERTDPVLRRFKLLTTDQPLEIVPWIENCAVKDTPISRSKEYQIVAECNGENLVFNFFPIALSVEALDEMSMLLSPKSRGEIDDFIGKYFTGPPEVSEILKKKLVII